MFDDDESTRPWKAHGWRELTIEREKRREREGGKEGQSCLIMYSSYLRIYQLDYRSECHGIQSIKQRVAKFTSPLRSSKSVSAVDDRIDPIFVPSLPIAVSRTKFNWRNGHYASSVSYVEPSKSQVKHKVFLQNIS